MDFTPLLQFLGMLCAGCLAAALFVLTRDYFSTYAENRREAERQRDVIALRQRYLGIAPGDPGAHEGLGDALRSAGYAAEALAAYEEAKRLGARAPAGLTGGGPLAGSGLETKIRLAQLEIAQRADPARHGMTMATREAVCSRCGALAPPAQKDCPQCGAPLPIDSPLEAFRHTGIRRALAQESAGVAAQVTLCAVAAATALALPGLWRMAALLAAAAVLAVFFLRRVGNPPMD